MKIGRFLGPFIAKPDGPVLSFWEKTGPWYIQIYGFFEWDKSFSGHFRDTLRGENVTMQQAIPQP